MFPTDLNPLFASRAGSGLGRASPAARVFRATVPRGFRPLSGEVKNVRFGGTVPHSRGHTAAQRLGLAYETRVHDVLSQIYGESYQPHPAILFEDRRGLRRAIPDGILRVGRTLIVVEVKLSHTERAWWQLRRLYIPLLNRLSHSDVRIVGLEICRSFDPSIQWPERFDLITSLHEWTREATRKGGATDVPMLDLGAMRWQI